MAGKVLLIVALAAVLGTASASESKAIMTAILNMFHGIGNAEAIFAPGAIWIDEVNAPGVKTEGPAAIKAVASMYRTMMSDIHFKHEGMVASPIKDGQFLASWEGTGTHTGEVNGLAPLGTGQHTYRGVNKVWVNSKGMVTKVQVMHGDFLLEKIGHLNKMMVDTDAITKVFMGWWNYENDLLKDLVSADVAFVDNINQAGKFTTTTPDSAVHGIEGMTALREMYKVAFPDMKFTNNYATPLDGNKFFACWTFSGTHKGPMGPIPATGKVIKAHEGCNTMTVRAGTITHIRVNHASTTLHELGLLPTAGGKQEL